MMIDSAIAIIVAAGSQPEEDDFYRPWLEQAAFSIAADGGLAVFFRLRLLPSLLIGDADSLSDNLLAWAGEQKISVRKFAKEKDATDTQLALDEAMKRGYRHIYIFGGIGSRLDHTLANLNLLLYARQKSADVWLLNPWHQVCLLSPEMPRTLAGKSGDLVSIIPATPKISGLTLQGFRWDMNNKDLQRGPSITVSNYMTANEAILSLEDGIAFVIRVKEK